MTQPIPVIDISDGPTPAVLDQIRDAGERFGAFQVVGHGISQSLIEDWEARIARILDLPASERAELASPTGHPYRGWRQWPDDFGRLELERYMIARFDDADDARAAGVREDHLDVYEHANVWPADDPQLQPVTVQLRGEVIGLAERLLGYFAAALGVPGERLAWPGPDTTSVTVNEYPSWTWPDDVADDDDETKLLLLEHADGNVITLLRQSGRYEGLQTQHADGSWAGVPVRDDSFVVLFGSSLVRLTNDRWLPGRHRVVAGAADRRRSTAYFYGPPTDVELEPIPELVGDGEALYGKSAVIDGARSIVDDYLRVFARPDQIEAWQSGSRFVADVRIDAAHDAQVPVG